MRAFTRSGLAAAVLLLGIANAPSVRADMVLLGQTAMVFGTQSFVMPFVAPSDGTIKVQLTNLAWPERLSNLSFAATTATSVLSSMADSSVDTLSFQLGGPGTYYAHVTGTAQGALQVGLYSLRVTFQPSNAPPAVGLPGSAGLLLAGLAGMLGLLTARRMSEIVRNPATLRAAFA
jgi:hypothetical protein